MAYSASDTLEWAITGGSGTDGTGEDWRRGVRGTRRSGKTVGCTSMRMTRRRLTWGHFDWPANVGTRTSRRFRAFAKVARVESVEAYFTAATQHPAGLAKRAQFFSPLQPRSPVKSIGPVPCHAQLKLSGYLSRD
jgi:hypothetical protein